MSLCRNRRVELCRSGICDCLRMGSNRRNTDKKRSTWISDSVVKKPNGRCSDEIGRVLAWIALVRLVVPYHCAVVKDVGSGIDKNWLWSDGLVGGRHVSEVGR